MTDGIEKIIVKAMQQRRDEEATLTYEKSAQDTDESIAEYIANKVEEALMLHVQSMFRSIPYRYPSEIEFGMGE